jgi:ribosome-associated protein
MTPRITPKPKKNVLKQQIGTAINACVAKKAERVSLLQLDREHSGFTDYFIICSGTNPRQIQAISDEVQEKLEGQGVRVTHAEGYKQAEWVLLDYVDFVVHVFSEKARGFYDLERLWKSAKQVDPQELLAAPAKKRAAAPRKSASARKNSASVPKKRVAAKKKKL